LSFEAFQEVQRDPSPPSAALGPAVEPSAAHASASNQADSLQRLAPALEAR